MKFNIVAGTDVGARKSVNQDSFLVKTAHTLNGDVCMALICDGMGGLEQGEIASQTVASLFNDWFTDELKGYIGSNFNKNSMDTAIKNVFREANKKLIHYGKQNNIRLGTTASIILFINGKYYIYHIGDTRIYKFEDKLIQLTQDHTLVAAKVKNGQLTTEEAKYSNEKHILLQCVGVNELLEIQKTEGTYESGDVFFLCCDGQYNKLEEKELTEILRSQKNADREQMQNAVNYLINTVKKRGETDNITGMIIRT